MVGPMARIRIPLAPIGGTIALVFAFGGAFAALSGGAGATVWLSIVSGAGGGGLALWRREELGVLAVADGLLALAVLWSLFGFGLLFLLPLAAVLVATIDTPARGPARRYFTPPGSSVPAFAAGPARRLARPLIRVAALRRPAGAEPEAVHPPA
jgi:hypothetical protein